MAFARRLAPSLPRPRIAPSSTRSYPWRTASTAAAPSSAGLRTGLYTTVLLVSSGLFAVYYFDARSAIHRYLLTPLLRYGFDAETGHKLAVKVLRSGFGPYDPVPDNTRLKTELWGYQVSNPIGLAAGFDKDGEAIDGLFNLGFSWVEIGSVTPRPQPGNPKPRVFHLPDDSSLINRYGFPSQGHAAVVARLRTRTASESGAPHPGAILAVNLGKNKDSPVESVEDFVKGVKVFGPHADVVVINVSSPNTTGLRGLQTRDLLQNLLAGVGRARDELENTSAGDHRPKLMLKVAPDLTPDELVDIADVVRANGVDGVIVSNTTVARPTSLIHGNKSETGGLSGPPLKPLSLAALRTLRAHLPANIPIIGCGGITSGADALEYARAGAALVQMYTHFGYDGVGACRRVKDELARALEAENTTWNEVVSKANAALCMKESARGGAGEGEAIHQLVEEAENLRRLLDDLSERA